MLQDFFNQQYTCKSAYGDEGYVICLVIFVDLYLNLYIYIFIYLHCIPLGLGSTDSVTSYFSNACEICELFVEKEIPGAESVSTPKSGHFDGLCQKWARPPQCLEKRHSEENMTG